MEEVETSHHEISSPLTASGPEPSERDLLARARSGDRQAQTVLYEMYIHGSAAIRRFLRRATQDEAQREDLLHEIYLAALRGASEFRGDSRLSTYLFRLAQLTVLDSYRAANAQKRGGHIRMVGEAEWAEHPGREPRSTIYEYEEVETRIALERMLESVPESYREALRLRVVDGLEYSEIAESLGVPLNTVGSRIFKGKSVLVQLLRNAGFRLPQPFLPGK